MKLLHLVGLVLTGFTVVVSGVTFERDVTAINKFSVAAAGHGALNSVIHDRAPVIDTKPQDSRVTSKKCSHGGDSVLAFASGSWNEAQSCRPPFVCCDTGLDAEVGCFCKINTADSSRPQDGNDVHMSSDPSHRGRLCFNDRTGIWRCIKGFCAPEQYCLDEGKMCQNTDTGPICGSSEIAEQILAAGCTDSCQCGCRGRGSTRFCPCSEQLAERSIEVSAGDTGNSATEIEATSATKDDTLSLGRSCNVEGAKQCGSDWVAVMCKNRQWTTWKACQKRQKCTQKRGQDPYCSPRKLPLADI